MQQALVRPAEIDDAEGVAAVHVQGWRAAYRGILSDELLAGLSEVASAERHRERLRNPARAGVQSQVVVRGDDILGWAAMGPSRDEDLGSESLELYALYVLPGCIGQGYGRLLMDHCLEQARAAGASRLALWVFCANDRARRFYEVAGFLPDASVSEKTFRDTGARELRMMRAL